MTINKIFKCKDRSQKDEAMYKAHLKCGYTFKETAEYIGIDYATVSRVIRKIERIYEK